jgi:hypothetical protein
MSSSDPAHNKRKSARFLVMKSRQQSMLYVDKQAFPVHLVDESLGGFAVLINRNPGLRVGEVARLQTDNGLFDVRMIRLSRADSSGNIESNSSDGPSTWYVMGLCRIGESLQGAPKIASVFSEKASLYRTPTHTWIWVVAAIGLIGALSAVGVPILMSQMHWGSYRHKDTGTYEAQMKRKLTDSIRQSPGANALLIPEVASDLNLTKDQTEAVRRLLDDLSKAMQTLDRESSSKNLSRSDISRIRERLQKESRKEALKILDSNQYSKWKEIDPEP